MNRRPTTVRAAAAALSSAALMLTLSACGGAANGESADSLSKVSLVFKGALTVCTDSPYAPFVYEEKGKLVGFDVDLAKQVADKLKVDLDVIDVAFDDITSGTSLNTDACDVTVIATGIGNKDVISPNTIFGSAAGKGNSPYSRDLKTGFERQLGSSAGYSRPAGTGARQQKNLEIPSFLRRR
jgi:hypothetical protein